MNKKLAIFSTLTLVFFPGWGGHAMDIDQTYSAKGITKIKLEHTEGSIHVAGTKTDSILLQVKKINGDQTCITRVVPKDSVFEIKTVRSLFGRITCEVDMNLVVPKNLPLEGYIGASNFEVKDLLGDLNLTVGAGSIEGAIGSSHTKLKTGAGQINLRWLERVENGLVDLEVGTGLVTLEFPKGTVVDASLESGLGSISNEVETSSKSLFKLKGKIGFGSVRLKYR